MRGQNKERTVCSPHGRRTPVDRYTGQGDITNCSSQKTKKVATNVGQGTLEKKRGEKRGEVKILVVTSSSRLKKSS